MEWEDCIIGLSPISHRLSRGSHKPSILLTTHHHPHHPSHPSSSPSSHIIYTPHLVIIFTPSRVPYIPLSPHQPLPPSTSSLPTDSYVSSHLPHHLTSYHHTTNLPSSRSPSFPPLPLLLFNSLIRLPLPFTHYNLTSQSVTSSFSLLRRRSSISAYQSPTALASPHASDWIPHKKTMLEKD